MDRRDTVFALLALTAQPKAGAPRIGVLIVGSAESSGQFVQAFTKGMAELGYQDGKNVRYEIRYGDGSSV